MAGETANQDNGLETIAKTTEKFTCDFLKMVFNEEPGNLITSPLSAQVVLAMAAYGARGRTAIQMRSVLLIPSDDELGLAGYQSIIRSINTVGGVELRIANKIYTDSSEFAVKSTYKELTAEKFLSESQLELDFNNRSSAAATINNWCETQTNNRIKDVVAPDMFDADTKFVLVNAVYFKGQWRNKFQKIFTKDRRFYIDKEKKRDVPTMYIKDKFRNGHIKEIRASFIEIPYLGAETSMIILLPDYINTLQTVMDNLDKLDLRKCLKENYPSTVELYLPKFKIGTTLDLNTTMNQLGMTDAFMNGADFSGIADIPLKINRVIQKGFIEVNEEGSVAAVVTAMVNAFGCPSAPAPPPIFRVDHPYIYMIYHNKTGIPLFTGIVMDPSAG